jgi:hypothetical protein
VIRGRIVDELAQGNVAVDGVSGTSVEFVSLGSDT